VITGAGADPNVAALVYIAGFAPDEGESVNTLIAGFPSDAPGPPILPPQEGFLFLDREKFHDSFAGDVDGDEAAFMADSQVPWGVEALSGTITEPAWRNKPSWYLLTTEDRMIPPAAQRTMSERAGSTVEEVAAPAIRSLSRSLQRWPRSLRRLLPQRRSAAGKQQNRTVFRVGGSREIRAK
jgi:hypothetical protein